MKLPYIVFVFSMTLIPTYKCDDNPATTIMPEFTNISSVSTATPTINSTIEATTNPTTITKINLTTEVDATPETLTTELNWSIRGLYGGYYNYLIDNPNNIHYIHGVYQSPRKNYYTSQNYFRQDQDDQTLDYYLGFGLSKMTDKNFKYKDFHHYYHDRNRTITDNDTIQMDDIISCHPNATYLCLENTETICLLNGTIYCMSKVDVVMPCPDNSTMECVISTVPCVKNCASSDNNLEVIALPCLAKIIIIDIYEDRKGMTIGKVGGTFILVPALKFEDRVFCVTVIVDPLPLRTQSEP